MESFELIYQQAIIECSKLLSFLKEKEPWFTYVPRGETCIWVYLNGIKITSIALIQFYIDRPIFEFMVSVKTDLPVDDDGIIRFHTYEEVLSALDKLAPLSQIQT